MKQYLIITLTCMISISAADSQYVFSDVADNIPTIQVDPLDAPVTIKRVYTDFTQVTAKLSQLGFTPVIKTLPANPVQSANIETTTTVRDFVVQAATKFGYTWTYQNNTITFNALNPIQLKPIVIAKITESVPITNESKEVIKPLQLTARTAALTTTSESGFTYNQGAQIWELTSADKTVRVGLSRWAKKAGWQLIWKANYDMPVEASVIIPGTFEFAVNEVCRASLYTGKQLIAEMHDKNKVIVIYTPAK